MAMTCQEISEKNLKKIFFACDCIEFKIKSSFFSETFLSGISDMTNESIKQKTAVNQGFPKYSVFCLSADDRT